MSPDLLLIILPALLAGVIVSSTHVPLGIEVLKRNIIFIDLAIAQIAGLGIIFSDLYFDECESCLIDPAQIIAFIFAISAALFFLCIEKHAKQIQEAIIGCSFVVASSLSLLLLANHPHGGEEIEQILAGQILWSSYKDLAIAAIVYAIILFIWFRFKERREKLFYPLFAICITFSVQIVGVYLVFATLIFSALSIHNIKRKPVFAYIFSISSYFIGIILSYLLDVPASSMIVMVFASGLAVLLILERLFMRL